MLRILKRQRTLRLPVVLEPPPPLPPPIRTSAFQIYVKPVLVSVGLTGTTFTIAALVHERQAELFWKQLRVEKPEFGNLRHIITDQQLLWLDLVQEKAKLWKQRQEEILKDLKHHLEQITLLPEYVKNQVYQITQAYINLPESKKTITGLIGLNMLVFLAWRIPPLQPSLQRQFFSGRNRITSCFAHRNALHLTVNMVGLYIFGPLVYDVLGREQFLAFYISLGMNANLIGYLMSVALKRPAVMMNYGASGSIYGLLAGSALLYPDTNIAIPFLPMLAVPINYAIPALVTTDIAGVLLRWRMFNHFTHLGGAVLGLSYMKYGPDYIWQPLLKQIRELKEKGGGGSSRGDGSGIMMEIPNKKLVSWLKKTSTVPEKQ
ncbi:hypothetical protein K501DRAFT_262919 [Backusella circina FSU 941]|nr:hypothetical protein K501DRAFT_262919 [Backusella circina FSU 941]